MILILGQGKEASMGYTKEAQSLPFGHDAKAVDDIDGLIVSFGSLDVCLLAEPTAMLAT